MGTHIAMHKNYWISEQFIWPVSRELYNWKQEMAIDGNYDFVCNPGFLIQLDLVYFLSVL